MAKGITNRGARGLEVQDQPFKQLGSSWTEPMGSTIVFDDFIRGATVWPTTAATSAPFYVTDTAAAGAGAALFAGDATAGAPVAGHGGWLRGTVSNAAAGAEEFGTSALFRPSRAGNGVLVFQTRVSLPSVTAVNMSTGLVAVATVGDGTAMNISGTTVLVTTSANGACFLMDTRGSTEAGKFIGVSVDNNVDSAASTAVAAIGDLAVLATSYVLRIEMDAVGNAYFYQGVADLPSTAQFKGMQSAAGSTLKATLLAAYVGVDNAGAAANKSIDVDYIFAAGAR